MSSQNTGVAQPTRLRLDFPRETGLILRFAGKSGNPFQTKQGNRSSLPFPFDNHKLVFYTLFSKRREDSYDTGHVGEKERESRELCEETKF